MIESKFRLKIFTYTSSTYTDISKEMADFGRDTITTGIDSDGYIYVGLDKPFNQFYTYLTTPNSTSLSLSIKYWNGSAWTAVSNKIDDTNAFGRSGFISWDRNPTSESKTTINSEEKYWIQIEPSGVITTMTLAGMGFLFADDNDLKTEVPEITDSNHLAGKTSHILTHVAVRNEIIQDLRNKDYYTTNQTTGLIQSLTPWDFLEANQIRQAAIYLALSKIYFNFSDSVDDKYSSKSNTYADKYKKAIDLARLSLDKDDDGIQDDVEQNPEFSIFRITR